MTDHFKPCPLIRHRLATLCSLEDIISPLVPTLLAGGHWWKTSWPRELSAGLIEPRRGYRFRPENLALALLLQKRQPSRVVDLGSGTGSLLLLASWLTDPQRAVAVELQKAQCDRLMRTIEAHQLPAVSVVGDLRDDAVLAQVEAALGGKADLILANPPFFPAGWGRPSKNETTRNSTHALHGDVSDFLRASNAILSEDGELLVVFDAGRVMTLLAAAGENNLSVREVAWIPDLREGVNSPFRVWVALSRGQGGAKVNCLLS